jgi:aldehyde dehydrogenase (NAD+)
MFAFKIGPALATGNTIIFKASEKSPLAVLLMAPLFKQAGFPDGVVNFVNGGGDVGDMLARHMQIRKISFTGSLAVGRKVLSAAAESNLKRVTLELGGKSPAVVFEDADLEKAIATVCQAILGLTGQACVSTARVLVQEGVLDQVVVGVKAYLEGARKAMGDPMDEGNMIGPLVDEKQFDRVMSFIEQGKQEAELITGGDREGSESFYVQPTLFVNSGSAAKVYREEIFGPVMIINTFKTEEDAVEMANDTEFGLFASIFTKDVKKGLRVAGKIEAGTVGINKGFAYDMDSPFGGWKCSGLGREGGVYGLKSFLQEKAILVDMA